eukprot:Colp12_sorted_trinity150504_noHs@12152
MGSRLFLAVCIACMLAPSHVFGASRRAASVKHSFTFKDGAFGSADNTVPIQRWDGSNPGVGCTGDSTIQFADNTWYGSDATMTAGLVHFACKGATRELHWHARGDEWAYVLRGDIKVAMPAPTNFNPRLPKEDAPEWDVDYSTGTPGSTWYFPQGWWHSLRCESDDGCELILFFNAPPSSSPGLNSLSFNTAMKGMPDRFAAFVMSRSNEKPLTPVQYIMQYKPAVLKSHGGLNPSNACNGPNGCPPDPSEFITAKGSGKPSTVNFRTDGNPRLFEHFHGGSSCKSEFVNTIGATSWDVTATYGMPFLQLSSQAGGAGSAGKGMSGQLIELNPGGMRPPVWTMNADAILYVIEGNLTLWIYPGPTDQFDVDGRAGGFYGDNTSKLGDDTITLELGKGELAFIPTNALYYFEESACKTAQVTLVFNHPEWREIDMRSSLQRIPQAMALASIGKP